MAVSTLLYIVAITTVRSTPISEEKVINNQISINRIRNSLRSMFRYQISRDFNVKRVALVHHQAQRSVPVRLRPINSPSNSVNVNNNPHRNRPLRVLSSHVLALISNNKPCACRCVNKHARNHAVNNLKEVGFSSCLGER